MQRRLLLLITIVTYTLCASGQDVNTFSLLNYNPSIIEKKLNIDSTELSFIEQLILDTYLSHPEMVSRAVVCSWADVQTISFAISKTW